MPTTNFRSNLSQVFLEVESSTGTRDFAFLALKSLRRAILDFQGDTQALQKHLKDLVSDIKNTTPKMSFLIFMFCELYDRYLSETLSMTHFQDHQKTLISIIDSIDDERHESVAKLIKHSEKIIEENDVILIHTLSHTTFDILDRAISDGKHFSIILSEQERGKTEHNIHFFEARKIPFKVIPEFLLHYAVKDISKVILGATTINSLGEVIADIGTFGVVSEMHIHHIPIYVALTTDKLSLWNARPHHHSFKSVKKKSLVGIDYEKMIFSHDRYPIHLVTQFITNKGLLTPEEMKETYDRLFSEQKAWRKRHEMEYECE